MEYDYEPERGNWRKFEGNPILGGPEMGTCFDVHVHRIAGGYRMYFSWRPKKSVAFVESADGIHWGEPRLLVSPRPESGWEDDINRNCVVVRDGLWHLWYTGQARGFSRIGYAKSSDGVNFRRVGDEPVMIPEFPWEKQSVMNPFVLPGGGKGGFRMWYAAGETYEPNALGFAESEDGIHWRKSPCNPIFIHGTEQYDKERVGGCEVVENPDGSYTMFYIGYEDIHTARICAATSPDGVTRWTRLQANPLLSPSLDSWDSAACYKPSALYDRENDRWMLWYNGRTANREYIGLATHPGAIL